MSAATEEGRPELCIAMPAYNEEGCIEQVVRGWCSLFEKNGVRRGRLIVVNDGSKDRTGEILDGLTKQELPLLVVHQTNSGHGAALRRAYDTALEHQPEYVFQVDSDDQFEVDDFFLLWEKRKESKFILGRRAVRHDSLHRLVITRILKYLNVIVFGKFIPDANIPFRLIEGEYLRQCLEKIPYGVFAPNIFLSVLAARDGQKLFSLPVRHKDRMTGTVSIVKWRLIKACARTARELVEFRRSLSR